MWLGDPYYQYGKKCAETGNDIFVPPTMSANDYMKALDGFNDQKAKRKRKAQADEVRKIAECYKVHAQPKKSPMPYTRESFTSDVRALAKGVLNFTKLGE